MEFNNYNLKISESLNNLKFQESKMKTNSKLKNWFYEGKIYESVKIRISDVNKAWCDLLCILGVIMFVYLKNIFSFLFIITKTWFFSVNKQ